MRLLLIYQTRPRTLDDLKFVKKILLGWQEVQHALYQNRVEDDGFFHQSPLVNSPVKSDPNYYWIIVPHAQKITESEFTSKTGINWKEFCESIKYWKDTYMKGKDTSSPLNYKQINKNEFFQEIVSLIGNMQLASGDIRRISSWGEIDGQIKLIDAGLTDDIYQSYYKK